MTLPIDSVLPQLIDVLKKDKRCVLQAPPGAGKTTQVPLALLNAGLFDGKIIMLEPRRLAARAAAERLAQQLNEPVGERVGYVMRGARKTGKNTRIEVVTEGILTRIIQSDPSLEGVSCIIFDEFHERNLQADLGLALCLEIRNALRDDLSLLVMSATLDAEPVAALMDEAQIITSEGRSYPVDVHYLAHPWTGRDKRNSRFETAMADLILEAYNNTQGSILAFLPGAGEIHRVEGVLKKQNLKDISIFPLYGNMPFEAQRQAIAPSSKRKLVLATSIAETSLTIEGISVVVDGGQARRGVFDAGSGMSRLITTRVTKAEATQREGRAGRLSKGQCYKLWTRGENSGLLAYPSPEILASDLTGLVLDLAKWGTNTSQGMPFVTHPRETDFANAQSLLRQIGALDAQNRITPLGHDISAMPVHPRLARVLTSCKTGCELPVAMMEARDVLQNAQSSDLQHRLDALQNPKSSTTINTQAAARIKTEAKRLTARGTKAYSLAQMAALAYPDRVGMVRSAGTRRYLLSGGSGAYIDDADTFGAPRLIVATDLDGHHKDARIRLAIEISESELREVYESQFSSHHICEWSKRDRRVIAQQQTRYGAIILSYKHWKDCPKENIAQALSDGIGDLWPTSLTWDRAARLLQARIEWLRLRGSDLPDCSDEQLCAERDDWILPHLYGLKTMDDVKKLSLAPLIKQRLSYEQLVLLDELAPASITAPTGTGMAIDYSAETPKISVRIQELFGLNTHPTIGADKHPLMIELLSPAQRPVQTTSDLPNFWRSSYSDVRKDMRGRYPRHPWPEDPTEAAPTKRAKPRKK